MKILKQVLGKQIEFGGEEHTGWLPLQSAFPRATPVEIDLVDVRILETNGDSSSSGNPTTYSGQ